MRNKIEIVIYFLINMLPRFKSRFFRTIYWNLRAKDIHDKWGDGAEDFETLGRVIGAIKPNRLLDIGCGSGRCFSLYMSMEVPEVVGQDISPNALGICKKRHTNLKYHLFCGGLEDLDYVDNYFDLIVSTRVLSAVLTEQIESTVAKLCRLADAIYLNEMTDSDYQGASCYWFKHDYDELMGRNGFATVEKGSIGKQTWKLYKKR